MKFKDFDELVRMVKGKSNRIVSPGANNAEVIEAIKIADGYGLISGGVLIGVKSEIESLAASAKLDLKKFELADCADKAEMCRKAVALIKEGKGDFLVKGGVDTALYAKAILDKEAKLVPEGGTLSHFVLFQTAHYHKLFGVTDAALLISPTLEQKKKIIENAVALMRTLGVERPKVAMVCPVEKVNPKVPSTVDADELSKMSKDGRIKDCVVEGPYDIYITVDRKLADEKGVKGGEVPGQVDIMVLPDLDAANPVYKCLTYFAEGMKSAAVVAGAKVPVILPSRTDPPLTKALSIALASFMKDQKRVAA
ncbi:MAG: phosphate butyryltransferase [Elusimicrobia bacterium]|nr:phosphate butyryltransferase [Elusimicrobiota bacterium]